VIFPSDHYVSDDVAFMAHVGGAFDAVGARPSVVVVLGIAPESPEVEYGWIEPGRPLAARDGCLYRVQQFWEKPPQPLAESLMARGCLWNSFVMVGRVSTFLTLIRKALPQLYYAFGGVHRAIGTPQEGEIVCNLYARLPPTNFSHAVLAMRPEHLVLLPVRDVGWSDWGQPSRVLSSLARHGIQERWAEPALAALA
jgi:mannose-1-phosphate guanylyltransferase